jgi:hypothetical protein
MDISFKFPQEIDNFRTVRNPTQLVSLLKEDRDFKVEHIKYRIMISKCIYLYAKCRLCSSRLVYRYCKIEEQFQLTKFDNEHNHPLRAGYHNNALSRFIKDLP